MVHAKVPQIEVPRCLARATIIIVCKAFLELVSVRNRPDMRTPLAHVIDELTHHHILTEGGYPRVNDWPCGIAAGPQVCKHAAEEARGKRIEIALHEVGRVYLRPHLPPVSDVDPYVFLGPIRGG